MVNGLTLKEKLTDHVKFPEVIFQMILKIRHNHRDSDIKLNSQTAGVVATQVTYWKGLFAPSLPRKRCASEAVFPSLSCTAPINCWGKNEI
jgi:hypothetical protein